MPKRIIVVDDEPSILKLLTKRLMSWGYLVLSASSGADLLAKLPDFKPDVILLDVMMPGLDGIDVADRMAKSPATASIPIVFVSAVFSPTHRQDSPSNPLHHYLGKPIDEEVLHDLLKRIGA